MKRNDCLQLAAQAWCTDANCRKPMDAELATAFGDIMYRTQCPLWQLVGGMSAVAAAGVILGLVLGSIL